MTNEDHEFFLGIIGGDLEVGFGKKYNIFCCEEAIKIANTLETKDKIVEFHKATWDDQKLMVPSIDDDHSGNTFGMSCKLAISYLPMVKSNKKDEKIDAVIK